MLKSSSLCLYSSILGTFWFKIEQFWLFIMKFKKRGDEIKKKSFPLKLQSQFQPNSAEMILGWPPSKIVSVDPDFQPRR
jgi:hypothetical protein